MALSDHVFYNTTDVEGPASIEYLVENGETVYNGAVCILTANGVRNYKAADDGTQQFAGFADDDNQTDGGAIVGNNTEPRAKAVVKPGGFIINDLAVASGAVASAVYASDDGTFTTVSTSNLKIGKIEEAGSASGLWRVKIDLARTN